MKKAATIFLLVVLVSVQTPAGQLFKIPWLLEHYRKHQKQNGISLLHFLKDHYASDHRDADLPEDEQLPFKNIPVNTLGFAMLTPAIPTTFFAPLRTKTKVSFPDRYTPQQHLSRIFHPPRG